MIKDNPDVFSDVTPETDLSSYIKEFLQTNPDAISSGPIATAKIGLLHGFPKDAVRAYVAGDTYRSNAALDSNNVIPRHGFMYAIGDATTEILNHAKKVEELYQLSGINEVLASNRPIKTIVRRVFKR